MKSNVGLFIATCKIRIVSLPIISQVSMTDKYKPAHMCGVALHRVGGIVDAEILGMCMTDAVVEVGAGGCLWQQRFCETKAKLRALIVEHACKRVAVPVTSVLISSGVANGNVSELQVSVASN